MQQCWRFALCVLLAAFLANCGGSTTTQSHVTPPVTVTNLANAKIAASGTIAVAMAEARVVAYYARYLRPGIGLSLGTLVANQPTPACDAATQTASTTTVDIQTLQNYSVLTAYYPDGDTTCSQSPVDITYMYYPNAALPQNGTPQIGYGYVIHFASANDPLYPAVRTYIGAESIWTAIYKMSDGTANIDTEIVPGVNQNVFPPVNLSNVQDPSPGTFPATFPAALPLPQTVAGLSSGGTYLATVESSIQMSQTGIAVTSGFVSNTGLNITVRPSGGVWDIAAAELKPAYYWDDTDVLSIVNTANPTNVYQLGAGNSTWTLAQPSTQGIVGDNFDPSQDSLTASYAPNGSIRSLHVVEIDTVNGIRCQLDAVAQNTFALQVKDLRANASAITPSTVLLDGDGNSKPYKYALDGSSGQVNGFSVSQ